MKRIIHLVACLIIFSMLLITVLQAEESRAQSGLANRVYLASVRKDTTGTACPTPTPGAIPTPGPCGTGSATPAPTMAPTTPPVSPTMSPTPVGACTAGLLAQLQAVKQWQGTIIFDYMVEGA